MPLLLEIPEAQQAWIDLIQTYENWRMDNQPNRFTTKLEGEIFWLKSNGKQRIRVTEHSVRFYNKQDGIDLTHVWNINSDKSELIGILDKMLDQMLKDRAKREEVSK